MTTQREHELLETAWAIIANAGGGDWDTQTLEWKAAAIRWRDKYHLTIPNLSDTIEQEVPA